VIAALSALGSHSLALLVYPGLLTLITFGSAMELTWTRLMGGAVSLHGLLRRRPTPVVVTVALCTMLAAVQMVAPFNLVPSEERSVVLAAVALAFTPWAELAITGEAAAAPGVLLTVQACWLLAVLGPAVQPQSLAPQVLGNVTVQALLPVKVASGLLYLLCLPAMLRLWPRAQAKDRRARPRFDLARGLTWLPYSGLFTTLFLTPPGGDLLGLLRFFSITLAVSALAMAGGLALDRRGAAAARWLYARAAPSYAVAVLVLIVGTSLLLR
jgi:hypothetical protein